MSGWVNMWSIKQNCQPHLPSDELLSSLSSDKEISEFAIFDWVDNSPSKKRNLTTWDSDALIVALFFSLNYATFVQLFHLDIIYWML